jgi:hypothetical protein
MGMDCSNVSTCKEEVVIYTQGVYDPNIYVERLKIRMTIGVHGLNSELTILSPC